MKRNLLLILALLPLLVFAQGSQNFDNQTAINGTSYPVGQFTENNITYDYKGRLTDQVNYRVGTQGVSFLLQRASDGFFEWETNANGLGTLSFDYRKAYEGATGRSVEIFVNDVPVDTTDMFGSGSGADATIHQYSKIFNESGTVKIKIKPLGNNTTGQQFSIDNIVWTAAPSSPPPSPIVNIPTPTLAFTQVAGTPSASQTFAVNGSNLTEDITVTAPLPFQVSKDGTTYSSSVTLEQNNGSVSENVNLRANAPSNTTPGTLMATITAVSGTANDDITATVVVSAPPPCVLDPMNLPYDIECHSNGTPDPLDDYITFKLNPLGVNLGSTYTVSVSSSSVVGNASKPYGSASTFQLATGSAGGGNISLTITDDSDNACTHTVTLTDPGNGCYSSTPNIILSTTTLDFGSVINSSISSEQTIVVEGEALDADIVLTLTGASFEMSETSGNSFVASSPITLTQTSGAVAPKTIYVRSTPTALGSQTGSITASSTNATSKTIALSVTGIPPTPELTVAPATLSGITNVTGSLSESSQTFTVSGENLTANIVITAPTNFQVSLTDVGSDFATSVTIPFGSGSVATTTVYVRSNATVASTSLSGTINIVSVGATTKTVTVSGSATVPAPELMVGPSTFGEFDHAVGTPSSSQQLNVKGEHLVGDITVSASANFEVSLDDIAFSAFVTLPHVSGIVAQTVVYIRAKATSIGSPFTGTITISSTNATNEVRNVSGTAAINYVPKLITEINQVDADGVGIHKNEYVELNGVVHCTNFHATGYRFIIVDQTGKGLYVFASGPKNGYFPPTHGDSLKLKGKIDQFNGLLQIAVDEVELLKQNAATIAPELVTNLGEETESQYIQMKRVRLVNPIPTFPSSGPDVNYEITDGTNTFEMRIIISAGFADAPAPQGWFHITSAIGSQFKNGIPYDSGYQIIPCGTGSIEDCSYTNAPIEGGDTTMKINDVIVFKSNGDAGEWKSSNSAVVEIDPITGEAKALKDGKIEIYHIVSICDADTQKVVVTVPKEDDTKLPDPPSSINDSELSKSISVFPNPVERIVTINHVGTNNVKFTIIDINGKIIVEPTKIDNTMQLDTDKWNKGVYFVYFKDDNNNSYVFKLVK